MGNGLFSPGAHFLKSQWCTAVFHDDRGGNLFGCIVHGNPDNGDVRHRRMGSDRCLDLGGVDVEPSR